MTSNKFENMEPMEAIRHMHNRSYFKETGNAALKKRVSNIIMIPFKIVMVLLFTILLLIARPFMLMFEGKGSPRRPYRPSSSTTLAARRKAETSAKIAHEQAKWDSMYDLQDRDGPLF